jgi:exonuclease III
MSDSKHCKGVAILFRAGLNVTVESIHQCNAGRRLLINVQLNNSHITFINIYAPTIGKERIPFMNSLTDWVNKYAKYDNLIIGGDFNSVYCSLDRKSKSLDQTSNEFMKAIQNLNLLHSWRFLNPEMEEFTWCHNSNSV